ncbi:MAG: CoA-binding protein [Bacteroidota bacterium]
MKKTLVLGASTNPTRYAYKAVNRLVAHGHEVIALGVKEGKIGQIPIVHGRPLINDLDTVSLYLNPSRQKEYYQYLLELQPKRLIFNPGTENPVLMQMAKEKAIEVVAACTLVLLSVGSY